MIEKFKIEDVQVYTVHVQVGPRLMSPGSAGLPQIGWITPDRLFYTVPRPERVGSKKKGRSMPKSQPVVRLDFDFIQYNNQ